MKNIRDDTKSYMDIKEGNSDRIFYDGGDEDSNVLTQDEKRM